MQHAKLLIRCTLSSWVSGSLDNEEHVAQQSSQVSWVLDQLENLTPVGKCIKDELPTVSCLKNLEILSFVWCLQRKICAIIQGVISLYLLNISKYFLFPSNKPKRERIKSARKIEEVAALFQHFWNTLYILVLQGLKLECHLLHTWG